MDNAPFQTLRARARDKRNKIISAANFEYESTLAKIADVELTINGKLTKATRKIGAAIEQVMPQDRPFTTRDILDGLEALDPGRLWRVESVNCHLTYLRERGLVVRVRRSKTNTPALYVRKGVAPPADPFRDMRLIDAIRVVLKRPMTPMEIAVALLEAGYTTTMPQPALRRAIGESLRNAGAKCVRPRWQPGG